MAAFSSPEKTRRTSSCAQRALRLRMIQIARSGWKLATYIFTMVYTKGSRPFSSILGEPFAQEANACWLPYCSCRHTGGPLLDKAHNQVDFLYTKGHMPFHPFSQSEGTRPARRNALCRVLILGLLFGVRNGQTWSKDMQNVGNTSCLRANVQKTQRCTCPRRIGPGLSGRKWRMILRQP